MEDQMKAEPKVGMGATTSTQQAITLTMVKKDANWLVSDFAWQK
jgi:hypothetical protein